MSYYRPSFSQTVSMSRGRGFSSSYRGSSRSSWMGPSERSRGGYGSSRGRFPPFSSTIESRSKYGSSGDRYTSSRGYDDYHKPYRGDMSSGGYPGRDGARSPDRKRLRPEAASSRRSHEGDSFNSSSGRYPSNSFSERRSFSRDDRRPSYSTSRDEFRRPTRPMSSTPRGGYRGRISSRGMRGMRLREVPPRRRLIETSYLIRKRLPPRIPTDYTRRLKISRLRSAISRRPIKDEDSDKEESDEKDDKVEDDDDEVKDDEKMENGEEAKDEEGADKKDSPKKTIKKEVADKDKDESDVDQAKRREFIKLVCPHCNLRCLTFNKYSIHLHSSRHMTAMRYVAMKQKSILARMRLSQRNAQRELEKSADDLAPRTNFCPLCKLNYRQPKATHQLSDAHKSMKKFLMPYCRFCNLTFKSPMLYETHICSIEHIKRKARNLNADKPEKDDDDVNEEDNIGTFMTIDSVGDFDEEEGAKKAEAEGKVKDKIDVGIEQIRKVEVYYCELCKMYLPRVEEGELTKNLSKHCKQRTHMQRYIRYKEDKELASHAERLQRKETAEKEREKHKKEQSSEPKLETSKSEEKEKTSGDDEENIDDKLWADDVNKDLGDILAEVESGNKSSDEDEDTGGQRYDRCRYSEKNEKKEEAQKEGAKGESEGEKKVEENVEEAK